MAVLLSRTQWNQDIFEGWIMLAAAVFVASMVLFMMRTGRKLKGQIEGKLETLAGAEFSLGIFAFIFLMVLREGVETVLILGAVIVEYQCAAQLFGDAAWCRHRHFVWRDVCKGQCAGEFAEVLPGHDGYFVFRCCTAAVSGLHELSENGVLPSSKREMAIIGPIVRNDLFFFITIFALAALMILFEMKRRQPAAG